MARHRAGDRAADVVMVAERLDEGDDFILVEDGDGTAHIGQVPDAALGAVDVVVEEDVAGLNRLDGEVANDRLDEGGVRPPGQLAAKAVVDAASEVPGFADHGRAGGPLDGGLDFGLSRRERAFDDLHEDRICLHAAHPDAAHYGASPQRARRPRPWQPALEAGYGRL